MDASFENLKEKSKEVGKEVGFTIELCAGIIDKPGYIYFIIIRYKENGTLTIILNT